MPPRAARNGADPRLVEAGIQAILRHADPRVVNIRSSNRLALATAMPQLRDEVDGYAGRRRDARLATPTAVQAARASLLDPIGMIASVAAVYRRIVQSVRAIGVLAARKTSDARMRNAYFARDVAAFLDAFQRRTEDQRLVGGHLWDIERRGDVWILEPEDADIPISLVPFRAEMPPTGNLGGRHGEFWHIYVGIKRGVVSLHTVISGQPGNPNQKDPTIKPHWVASIKMRIASDGSVSRRRAAVTACDELYLSEREWVSQRHQNALRSPPQKIYPQGLYIENGPNHRGNGVPKRNFNKATMDSCTTAVFVAIGLFGSGYDIVFPDHYTGRKKPLSRSMKGLRDALMR